MSEIGARNKQTDVTGKLVGDMQEPKVTDQNKLTCPVCKQTFDARNEYDEHWLGCHQDEGSMASGSMGSMNANNQQSCKKATNK